MFKSINAIEFNRRFIDNESCYQYLMNRKWGEGFNCSFCGCKESIRGRLIITDDVRVADMMRVLRPIPCFMV